MKVVGESWSAVSHDALEPGDKATVASVDGLVLRVAKAPGETGIQSPA